MWKKTLLAAATLAAGFAGQAQASNITPYYLFAGDQNLVSVIVNGTVVDQFDSFFLGYPVAIRETIWLGGRDDQGATEFNLNGTPTGNTSAGGNNFSQLLDGAAGNGVNYGVECCGGPNSITVANGDWSGQQVLFDLGGGLNGSGIAFDPTDNSLYVSTFSDSDILHFDLTGTLLDTIALGVNLVGLAYDGLTDTFWGMNTNGNHLVQFDRAGGVLFNEAVNLNGFGGLGNYFGGEMTLSDRGPTPDAPEPATLGLLGLGLAALGIARRRRAA